MVARLTLLQTFVVVARSARMKDAANALAITPGAVSQRIRELEDTAGRRLFERIPGGVRLNAAGARLFSALDEPFRAIEVVERRLQPRPSRHVTISTVASFAAGWLVPRLAGFSADHPEITVALEIDGRLVDLVREPVDLAVRHGLGTYPDLDVTWLCAPELIVVASPDLLKSGAAIGMPADCLDFPLLHDAERSDWPMWLKAHGVRTDQATKGSSFAEDHLLVRAAVAGQGLALVRNVYADDDIRSGRLVRAIATPWPVEFAYYAVATRQALQRPAVRVLRDWLVIEARGLSA